MSGSIFGKKTTEDRLPVGCGQVNGIQRYIKLFADLQGIGDISLGGTVTGPIVAFPVLHEQALQSRALLLEQQGRHRGIDAAGDGNDNGGRD